MEGLSNHPLLQPLYISKVLDSIQPDTAEYALTTDVPIVEQEGEQVIVDVRQTVGGMTMAVAEGAESPVIERRGRQQYMFMPAHFREKQLLGEKDVKKIRQIGTIDQLETAQQRITEILGELRMRLETRMEWSKWQMLYGSLAISQTDVTYSIDYKIPSHFKPALSGADRWTETNSDPMGDIMDWLAYYREEGTIPDFFMYNGNVEKLLLQNATIRELRDTLFQGQTNPALLNRQNISMVFNAYTGMQAKVYDKGYYHVMKLTSEISPTSNSFTVDENPGVEIGDYVTVVHKSGEQYGRARILITGVSGTTISHTTDVGGSVTYVVGSEVRVKKHFLGDDKFVIRGRLPVGTTGGPNWGEFISVNHVYGPGGLMNPQPGIFSKVVVKDDDDPPRIEVIAGVSGLPVLYHPTTNLIATVVAAS